MIFKQINRLQHLDQMLRQKSTGNAEELAKTLNLSKRHVYNLLEELKDMGVDINYSREIRSFCYSKPYRITINFHIEELSDTDIVDIGAGMIFFKKNVLCNETAQTFFIFEAANRLKLQAC